MPVRPDLSLHRFGLLGHSSLVLVNPLPGIYAGRQSHRTADNTSVIIDWEHVMKKIMNSYRRTPDTASSLSVKTGSHCPANGFWRPEDRSAEPVFVFEGSIMPAGQAGATVWRLEEGAFGPAAYPLPGLRSSR